MQHNEVKIGMEVYHHFAHYGKGVVLNSRLQSYKTCVGYKNYLVYVVKFAGFKGNRDGVAICKITDLRKTLNTEQARAVTAARAAGGKH